MMTACSSFSGGASEQGVSPSGDADGHLYTSRQGRQEGQSPNATEACAIFFHLILVCSPPLPSARSGTRVFSDACSHSHVRNAPMLSERRCTPTAVWHTTQDSRCGCTYDDSDSFLILANVNPTFGACASWKAPRVRGMWEVRHLVWGVLLQMNTFLDMSPFEAVVAPLGGLTEKREVGMTFRTAMAWELRPSIRFDALYRCSLSETRSSVVRPDAQVKASKCCFLTSA